MDRPGEPTIRECVPTAGPVGSRVTIYGANFGKSADERVVSFNSVRAEEVEADTAGGVDKSKTATRERGKADQKNLQSKQPSQDQVNESRNAGAEQTAKDAAGKDAAGKDAASKEPGKDDKAQESAQANAAATGGKTGAAKQPGDVAAQTQGSSATVADANLPPVERGELGPEGHGVAGAVSTATVTHRQADPSSEERIIVTVPEGATPGDVVVTVGGIASNGSRFTVTAV